VYQYTYTQILITRVNHYTDINTFKIRVHWIREHVLVNTRSKLRVLIYTSDVLNLCTCYDIYTYPFRFRSISMLSGSVFRFVGDNHFGNINVNDLQWQSTTCCVYLFLPARRYFQAGKIYNSCFFKNLINNNKAKSETMCTNSDEKIIEKFRFLIELYDVSHLKYMDSAYKDHI